MDEGLCLAEEMFDNNKYYYCEKAYYCNWVGFQYHAGIGVSKSIAARDDYYCSLIHANERCKQLYKLCKKDQYWKDYQSYRLKYIMCPTFNMYIKMCVSYGKAFEWSYNRITIKTDMAWFLKDSIKPIIKRFLGIKRCAEETNAINV